MLTTEHAEFRSDLPPRNAATCVAAALERVERERSRVKRLCDGHDGMNAETRASFARMAAAELRELDRQERELTAMVRQFNGTN